MLRVRDSHVFVQASEQIEWVPKSLFNTDPRIPTFLWYIEILPIWIHMVELNVYSMNV